MARRSGRNPSRGKSAREAGIEREDRLGRQSSENTRRGSGRGWEPQRRSPEEEGRGFVRDEIGEDEDSAGNR